MSTESVHVEIGNLVIRTPGIKGGTPHLAGTSIAVRTIVRFYQSGLSPEEISAEYPHLDLAQIYAGLAYYHANRAAMDAEMAAEQDASDALEREWLRQEAVSR